MRSSRTIAIGIFLAFVMAQFTSCVPAKKFEELNASYQKLKTENDDLKAKVRSLEEAISQSKNENQKLQGQIKTLEKDTTSMGKLNRELRHNYNKLKESYDLILENKNSELAQNAEETKRLIEELQTSQEELIQKEDALKTLELELGQRSAKLEQLNAELAKREARVAELESMMARKDSAVNALKTTLQKALLGFEDNGLSIEQRNGKVYVSLDESLLFASGSSTVNPKGTEVLKKLGSVLEQNEDIQILVEGHTDNVPYKGSGQLKDNWDLSVMRATSVVKIITSNSKVDPKRLTAAGRSEFLPLDKANSKEARQKNRRTEIILAPNLDELYKLLNEEG